MALSAATVLEVQNGGADTNGGGFTTGGTGTDWSQQTAAQYSVTDGVTAGTTTITSLTAAFGTDVVDNLISVSGGTGAVVQNWYRIISRTNATTIVVDRSTGLTAGTGVTLKIGGAFASPGGAGACAALNTVAGLAVFVKYNASPYPLTSATQNVSGGVIGVQAGQSWFSYDTTRTFSNSDANRSTLQIAAAVSTATIINGSGCSSNFILDGNSQTASKGFQASLAFNCKSINCTTSGFGGGTTIGCEATACAIGFTGTTSFDCEAYTNTGNGFQIATCVECLSYGNTGGSTCGFQALAYAQGCVAYGNGSHGFNQTASSNVQRLANCIAESNSGFGFNVTAGSNRLHLVNCASYLNTSGRSNTPTVPFVDQGAITGSGSFFTNAVGGVFALNATAGGGALARAAGFPATFPAGLTANFRDAGAAQHQDSPVTLVNTTTTIFLEV